MFGLDSLFGSSEDEDFSLSTFKPGDVQNPSKKMQVKFRSDFVYDRRDLNAFVGLMNQYVIVLNR
jgi:hypothetical protein